MNKQRSKVTPRKKRKFVIDESIKQFFPPVSRMGGENSSDWGLGAETIAKQKLTRQKPA